jgi:2-methylisocitrate lyase-like PEP mutase family enzyme
MMSSTSRRQFIAGTGGIAGGLLTALPTASAQRPDTPAARSAGSRFRALLATGDPQQCPNVHDVISAKLAVAHGFPLVLTGGGAISQGQFGMGDYGMLTITEMIDITARIADAVDVPIIADGDDCGGNPLNVVRAIRRFERAGAACVLLEDLTGAKHLPGVPDRLLSTAQMVDKIKAATDARRDSAFALLARCDAPRAEALDRVAAYAEAGADLIMVGAVPPEDGSRVVELTKRPLLSTRPAPLPELKKNRVSVIVYSGPLLNAAFAAMDLMLGQIRSTGIPSAVTGFDRDRLARITGRDESVATAKRFNVANH